MLNDGANWTIISTDKVIIFIRIQQSSVVDQNTLHLDSDSEMWLNFDPDPVPDRNVGLCSKF